MSGTVDFKRPYQWKGGNSAANADFILQDGVIYVWSESNVRYEPAWWFNDYIPETPLLLALRKERALPEGDWQPSDSYEAIDGSAVRGFGSFP